MPAFGSTTPPSVMCVVGSSPRSFPSLPPLILPLLPLLFPAPSPTHLSGEDFHPPALEYGGPGPQEHPEMFGRVQPHLGGSPREQSVQDGPRTAVPAEVQRGEDEFVQVFTFLHRTHSKKAAAEGGVRTYICTYVRTYVCILYMCLHYTQQVYTHSKCTCTIHSRYTHTAHVPTLYTVGIQTVLYMCVSLHCTQQVHVFRVEERT